jgi:hypothetical protein
LKRTKTTGLKIIIFIKQELKMKKQDMLRFFINIIIIILLCGKNYSQAEKDSISLKNKYGIRIGLDFSKQIRMLTEDYSGLSLYGDIKIKERVFIVR